MKKNPLDKREFMDGVRQKWCVIFIICGFIVLTVNVIMGMSFNPTPYMQFLLAIGSLFILGASGDSWVQAYSVKSITETEMQETTKRSTITVEDNSKPNMDIIMKFQKEYADEPSYAPLEWVNKQTP